MLSVWTKMHVYSVCDFSESFVYTQSSGVVCVEEQCDDLFLSIRCEALWRLQHRPGVRQERETRPGQQAHEKPRVCVWNPRDVLSVCWHCKWSIRSVWNEPRSQVCDVCVCCRFAMGIEFREGSLVLNAKNQFKLKRGECVWNTWSFQTDLYCTVFCIVIKILTEVFCSCN